MTTIQNLRMTENPQSAARVSRVPPGLTVAAGAFYVCMGGIHIGIALAAPSTYSPFAEESPWAFVRNGWSDVFMAHPMAWGFALAAGEIALGVLLLIGGLYARVGWVGVIVFQGLLVLFGWGFLLWSVPAGVLLALGARHDWQRLAATTESATTNSPA